MYINTKKASHWADQTGLALPPVDPNGETDISIPTAVDLVNLRRENPTLFLRRFVKHELQRVERKSPSAYPVIT